MQEHGSLSFTYVAIEGTLSVLARVILAVQSSTLTGQVRTSNGNVTMISCTINTGLDISDGSTARLSDCDGGLTSLTVTDSTFSMDASSTTTLGGGISLSTAGVVVFEGKLFDDSASLVLSGGTHLRLRTGHVAASSVPRRRWPRFSQPSLARMAHARHGPHDRPFGPAQIMHQLRRPSLRRCGRVKVELARRHAQTYDLSPEIRLDNRGKMMMEEKPA